MKSVLIYYAAYRVRLAQSQQYGRDNAKIAIRLGESGSNLDTAIDPRPRNDNSARVSLSTRPKYCKWNTLQGL